MQVRFVELITTGNTKVWINPGNVCWVQLQAGTTDKTAVATADSDSPFFVCGTVGEVLTKLTVLLDCSTTLERVSS